MNKLSSLIVFLAGALLASAPCRANGFSDALRAVADTTPAGMADSDAEGFFGTLASGTKNIWQNGRTELVQPFYTEHPRWDYSNRNQENAWPWGGGIARSVIDSRGNERILYAIAFSDSHYQFEPFLGYAWLARWQMGSSPLHVGAGYLLGLTFRSDYHWYPIPAPLPLINVGTDRVGAYMTYIPGSNVFFFFLKVGYEDREHREMPLTEASPFYGRNNLLFAGGNWVHNDLGSPEGLTMSSNLGWNVGLRHYFSPHIAAELGYTRSKHHTSWYGNRQADWRMSQVHLVGQYHMTLARPLRVFAGAGIGYARLSGSSHTAHSVHPVIQTGFTWAIGKEVHVTGAVTTSFARFKNIGPEGTKGTARPAPNSISLSIGKTI